MPIALFVAVISLVSFAFAEPGLKPHADVGNGGEIIICEKEDGNKTYEFYDYREWALKPGYVTTEPWKAPFKIDSTDTAIDIVGKVISNLRTIDQRMALRHAGSIAMIQAFANFFDPDTDEVPKEFKNTDDGGHWLAVDEKCKVEQLIVQLDTKDWKKKIFINKKLWDKLDPLNQAIAWFHESLYHQAIKEGKTQDALRVRYANKHLFSLPVLNVLDLNTQQIVSKKYVSSWWANYNYEYVGWREYLLKLPSKADPNTIAKYMPQFYENNILKEAFVVETRINTKSIGSVPVYGKITFYDSGSIKSFEVDPTQEFNPVEVSIGDNKMICNSSFLLLPDGTVESCN